MHQIYGDLSHQTRENMEKSFLSIELHSREEWFGYLSAVLRERWLSYQDVKSENFDI